MGYELVRVHFSGGDFRPTLQIMAERIDRRSMAVEDCAEISRVVSALLDVEDPLPGAYELEVSSPGIDRPLLRPADYERFAGFEARFELSQPVEARCRQPADPKGKGSRQIWPADAPAAKPGLQLGEFLIEELPPIDFGRSAAQTAKQVIVQKVREAERRRQFEEFKDRKADIVNGLVKRVEFGNVTVDLGRGEGILRRDELLPRETFRPRDRVRAYIYDVRRETRGPQIFLSRTHPQFMAKLFAQEVPEVYDGIIEI